MFANLRYAVVRHYVVCRLELISSGQLAKVLNDDILTTGGSHIVINLWHDSTAADKAKAADKEDEVVFAGGQHTIIPSTEAEGAQNLLKIAT
ncbi:hypothetical protein Tco_1172588 [Tanacetum coccineum]